MSGEYAHFQEVLSTSIAARIKKMVEDATWMDLAEPVYQSFLEEASRIAGDKSTIDILENEESGNIQIQGYVFISSDDMVESKLQDLGDLLQRAATEGSIGQKGLDTLKERLSAIVL